MGSHHLRGVPLKNPPQTSPGDFSVEKKPGKKTGRVVILPDWQEIYLSPFPLSRSTSAEYSGVANLNLSVFVRATLLTNRCRLRSWGAPWQANRLSPLPRLCAHLFYSILSILSILSPQSRRPHGLLATAAIKKMTVSQAVFLKISPAFYLRFKALLSAIRLLPLLSLLKFSLPSMPCQNDKSNVA